MFGTLLNPERWREFATSASQSIYIGIIVWLAHSRCKRARAYWDNYRWINITQSSDASDGGFPSDLIPPPLIDDTEPS